MTKYLMFFFSIVIYSCSIKNYCGKPKEEFTNSIELLFIEKYGDKITKYRPFQIESDGDYWVVRGTLDPDMIGGVPIAKINKNDCNDIEIYHTK